MTTPGSVRTKIWRSGNKKRYSDYQREYMRKYREKKKGDGPTEPIPNAHVVPADGSTQ